MQSSDIAKLSKSPSSIGQEEINLLQNSVERMPWCSTHRVLLARGYSNEDSYLQNKHLRLAATYSGDKGVLFQFMTSEELEAEIILEQPVPVIDTSPTGEVQTDSSVQDTPEFEETKIENIESLVEPESEYLLDIQEEPIKESATETEEESREKETEVEELVGSSTEESVEEKIDFESIITYDPLKELEPIESPIAKNEEVDFDYVSYDPERELTKLIEEKEEEDEHSFLFWLNNVEDKAPKKKKSTKSPDHVQDLLDQFLATKRSRPIQNREFYKAESKAEESEIDNMDVVSETLLELYVKQGHKAKAIKGYKKLSLQNPEKSAYFAARIKEIEHKEF